jgi:hypothetical protein
VKFTTLLRWGTAITLACSLSGFVWATDKPSDKDKKDKSKSGSQMIDSGVFGVVVKGQRVVTETFSVQQENGNSIIKAQLKETAGATPTSQKSSLEINGAGELIHYEWSQSGGGSLSVMPNNEFLLEKISATGSGKAAEQAFLMPSSSMILDNNFFVQREVLAWRYLAADCKRDKGELKCQTGPVDFGALVPQDRTSMHVRMELVGKESVTIGSTQRQLLRLNLTGDGFEWALWVDDQDSFKLIRIAIPADSTEVVRD